MIVSPGFEQALWLGVEDDGDGEAVLTEPAGLNDSTWRGRAPRAGRRAAGGRRGAADGVEDAVRIMAWLRTGDGRQTRCRVRNGQCAGNALAGG